VFYRFAHESDHYPGLSRLPLYVRMKLDLAGIKISLKDWLAFSFEERTVLCHLPIETDDERTTFSSYIDFLSRRYGGQPAAVAAGMDSALWQHTDVPNPVAQKSAATSRAVTLAEWRRWAAHERYALYKTAISKSQPEVFEKVLDELRRQD
jgi:hypothetical protein